MRYYGWYSNKMRGQRKKQAEEEKEAEEVEEGVRVDPQRQTGTDPPTGEWVYEPVDQDPFPDYDTEPVLFYANA